MCVGRGGRGERRTYRDCYSICISLFVLIWRRGAHTHSSLVPLLYIICTHGTKYIHEQSVDHMLNSHMRWVTAKNLFYFFRPFFTSVTRTGTKSIRYIMYTQPLLLCARREYILLSCMEQQNGMARRSNPNTLYGIEFWFVLCTRRCRLSIKFLKSHARASDIFSVILNGCWATFIRYAAHIVSVFKI